MISRFPLARCMLAAAALTLGSLPTTWAGPLPLGSLITAQADSGALFTSADGYSLAGNPVSATLSDGFGDLEFLTDDFLLGLDFLSDGTLAIYGLGQGLSRQIDFDFAGLADRLATVSLTHAVSGLHLQVVDHDTLRLRLDAVNFADDGSPYVATITVPEPGAGALVALALAALGLALRRQRAGGAA